MSAALTAHSLSVRFAAAIELLCRGVTASLPKRWDTAPLTLPTWVRLRRLLARLLALIAAVEAGRLRAVRRTTPRAARPHPATASVRLPGQSGWLLKLAPELNTRIGRSQIETLLGDPELAALLAQAPQAGRILRPLCHMLGIAPPQALVLPRRPRVRRRPDRSGGTDATATAAETPPARGARPNPPSWLIRPPSPPLPTAEEWAAAAPPYPARTGPPGR